MIIYSIYDPISQQVFYVGKTKNLTVRKYQHISGSHSDNVHNRINKILDNGKVPIFSILEECSTEATQEAEKKWIKHYIKQCVPLYNICHVPKEKNTDINTSTSIDAFKNYILTQCSFPIKALAKRMWPKNTTASHYLCKKLNNLAGLTFTYKDEQLARKALLQLSSELIADSKDFKEPTPPKQ